MKRKNLRIYITTNDIAQIEFCSMRSASQRMNDLKVFFNKNEKRFKITFDEYAKYRGIPVVDLEPFRMTSYYHVA
jgi:hypothetical protein